MRGHILKAHDVFGDAVGRVGCLGRLGHEADEDPLALADDLSYLAGPPRTVRDADLFADARYPTVAHHRSTPSLPKARPALRVGRLLKKAA